MGENQQQHILSVSKVNGSSSRLQPTENNLSQVKYMSNHNYNQYQQNQLSYSPIKVQFCTSQVGTFNLPNKWMKENDCFFLIIDFYHLVCLKKILFFLCKIDDQNKILLDSLLKLSPIFC